MAETTEQFLCGDCQQTYAEILEVDLGENTVTRRCKGCHVIFWANIAHQLIEQGVLQGAAEQAGVTPVLTT